MSRDYSAHEAADPELYERLMEERYGPLADLLTEKRRKGTLPPPPGTYRYMPVTPEEAAHNYAELARAIEEPRGPRADESPQCTRAAA
ncbi:hypothetical protein OHO28_29275 [Streptomyces europaeiscabiei]|uniref:hypothetical protein n=1 Tax=Streptomyces europaeiscabiei TaxID=146819 RepID=UPI002E16E972